MTTEHRVGALVKATGLTVRTLHYRRLEAITRLRARLAGLADWGCGRLDR